MLMRNILKVERNGQTTQYAGRRANGLPAVFGEQTNDGLSFNGQQKIEMASLAGRQITWDESDKLRIEAWFFPNEAALTSEGNLPPQRFVTFKDTLGAPKITVDFYVEADDVYHRQPPFSTLEPAKYRHSPIANAYRSKTNASKR
eukprot:UN04032